MIEMTTSAANSYLTLKFDDFLFARITANGDETPLSVLSVLARLGIDPWEEAARLTQLPRLTAAERLASLIAATPGAPSAYLDAATVSERLISLLPSPPAVTVLPRLESGVRPLIKSQAAIWMILVVFLLLIQLFAVNRQPPSQANEAHAPSSSTVSP
ncbi:MAG: hypothetical protein ACLPPF_17640 [Rhodomicrobium sp.]